MLLSSARLLALPKSRENAVLLQQSLASCAFDFDHFVLLDILPRWDAVEIEVFAENDDTSTVLQHVTSVTLHGFNGHRAWRRRILAALVKRLILDGLRDSLSHVAEKLEHVL